MKQRHKNVRRSRATLRRSGRCTRPAQVLAGAAAIAAGTQAYADPVRFDNPPPPYPDHFDWRGPLGTETWLDMLLPAASQPGAAQGPSSFGQTEIAGFGRLRGGLPGVEMEVGGLYDLFLIDVPIVPGVCIPSGAPWSPTGYVYYAGYGSQLPAGEMAYLGLRFDPGDGIHYGWMAVIREDTGLEPLCWGYESDPGVPICYPPEPGTLSLLAFGALLVGRRRR